MHASNLLILNFIGHFLMATSFPNVPLRKNFFRIPDNRQQSRLQQQHQSDHVPKEWLNQYQNLVQDHSQNNGGTYSKFVARRRNQPPPPPPPQETSPKPAKESSSFISSLLGSILPGFDISESTPRIPPVKNSAVVGSTKGGDANSYTRIRSNYPNGGGLNNMEDSLLADASSNNGVLRTRIKGGNIKNKIVQRKKFDNLAAIRSGYAQVNRHRHKLWNNQKNPSNKLFSNHRLDPLRNRIKRPPPPKSFFNNKKRPIQMNRQKIEQQQQPNVEEFCSQVKSMAKNSFRMSKEILYQRYWTLLRNNKIPIVRQEGWKKSSDQMELILDSFCGIKQQLNQPENDNKETTTIDKPVLPFLNEDDNNQENNEQEIITVKPNNPLDVKNTEKTFEPSNKEGKFVVSGSFSFDKTNEENSGLKKGQVLESNLNEINTDNRRFDPGQSNYYPLTQSPRIKPSISPFNEKNHQFSNYNLLKNHNAPDFNEKEIGNVVNTIRDIRQTPSSSLVTTQNPEIDFYYLDRLDAVSIPLNSAPPLPITNAKSNNVDDVNLLYNVTFYSNTNEQENTYYPVGESSQLRTTRPTFSPTTTGWMRRKFQPTDFNQDFSEFLSPPDVGMTFGTKTPNNLDKSKNRDNLSFLKAQGALDEERVEEIIKNRVRLTTTRLTTTTSTTTTSTTTTTTTSTISTTPLNQSPSYEEIDSSSSSDDNDDEYYYVYEYYEDYETSGEGSASTETNSNDYYSTGENEIQSDDYEFANESSKEVNHELNVKNSNEQQNDDEQDIYNEATVNDYDNTVINNYSQLPNEVNDPKTMNNVISINTHTTTTIRTTTTVTTTTTTTTTTMMIRSMNKMILEHIDHNHDDHHHHDHYLDNEEPQIRSERGQGNKEQQLSQQKIPDYTNDDQFYFKNYPGVVLDSNSYEDDLEMKDFNEVDFHSPVLDTKDFEPSQPINTISKQPSIRNDRFAKDGLKTSSNLAIESSPITESQGNNNSNSILTDGTLNPEKLAYILIGVSCGLSILCLIIVAISIGFKSETHYRLDEGNRKHRRIKLIKASSVSGESTDTTNGHSSDPDDGSDRDSVNMSNMKLGPWFNGKHNIATLDRKSSLAFPTSVYLNNLEQQQDGSGVKNKEKEIQRDVERIERVMDNDASLSSFDTIRKDPNLLPDDDHYDHYNAKSEIMTATATKVMNYKKNTSSYSIASSRFSQQGTLNLNSNSKSSGSSKLSDKRKRNRTQGGGGHNSTTSSSAGSFRYLIDNDTLESSRRTGTRTTTPAKQSNRDQIHWSTNQDRLI